MYICIFYVLNYTLSLHINTLVMLKSCTVDRFWCSIECLNQFEIWGEIKPISVLVWGMGDWHITQAVLT